MLALEFDTAENRVSVSAAGQTRDHVFSRRWAAHLLSVLLVQSQAAQPLTVRALQDNLARLGQRQPLNRSQLLRLLDSVQAFIDQSPELELRAMVLQHPPRQRTVGPWLVAGAERLNVLESGVPAQAGWPHAGWTDVADPGSLLDRLYSALDCLLQADAIAAHGQHRDALKAIADCAQLQLSRDAHNLLALRRFCWHKAVGQRVQAMACLQTVLGEASGADLALQEHARFSAQRARYDEDPPAAWRQLWQDSTRPPAPVPGADRLTLAEWHNLRALLARRLLLENASRPATVNEGSTSELHLLALRHLQAATYQAAWLRDWDRLQAYVCNLGYHLQAIRDVPALAVTSGEVLRWHRLMMRYEDKLGAGMDSAWHYIFFARFWLDELQRTGVQPPDDPVAHGLDGSHPSQDAFYLRALQRLRECGDPRQVAIGLTLHMRFARACLSGASSNSTVASCADELARLFLGVRGQQLRQSLAAEGYAAHWPSPLQ